MRLPSLLAHGLIATAASLASAASSPDPACTCTGAVVTATCYDSLEEAVDAAPSGATITIGGKQIISNEILFSKDLDFVGVECNGQKATLSANFNIVNNEYGMLRAGGPDERTVSFDGLKFTREPGSGQAAGFRIGDLFSRARTEPYTLVEAPLTNLRVSNCDFTGLETYAMGGAALYVHRAKSVKLDSSNTYTKNVIADSGRRFGGGGVVWITHVILGGKANIGGTFANNQHMYQHGVSAGYFSDMVEGRLAIDGKFYGNKASDGAAVHIFRPVKTAYVTINGDFEGNEATELGIGSRGGAIRFQNVEAPVLIEGRYVNNRAPGGRGGVVASNRFYKTGRMLFRGTFINNYANSTGGVFDQVGGSKEKGYDYVFEKGAYVTLDGSCVFQGNMAGNMKTSILNIGVINATFAESQWVPGQTVTFRGTEPYLDKGGVC